MESNITRNNNGSWDAKILNTNRSGVRAFVEGYGIKRFDSYQAAVNDTAKYIKWAKS